MEFSACLSMWFFSFTKLDSRAGITEHLGTNGGTVDQKG